jgi:hypothetical protein
MSTEELSKKKVRFYASLEAKLAAWAAVTLGVGVLLALPTLVLAVSSMGGMLVILRLAMKDPTYIGLRQSETATA